MNKVVTSIKNWNKYFILDKKYFEEFAKYTTDKLRYTWFKKLLMGFFGGMFVGLGYTGYLLMTGSSIAIDPILLKFIGSLLFPVALLLCMYFGGSLFTSSCMGVISVLYKEHKTKHYLLDLTLVLLGNMFGTFVFALIVWSSNLFGAIGETSINGAGSHLIDVVLNKIDSSHQWWNNLMSAILCNFIIVGSIIVGILTKKNGVGAFIIYLMLVIFVIGGLQHIVANAFLFSLGGFLSLHESATHLDGEQVGQIFYQNLIPTLIGNWIGGFGLTMLYLSGHSFVSNRKSKNKELNETKIIKIDNDNAKSSA